MIDPAHGGSESGAVLSPTILEKDVNLAFARRLRQELTTHSIVAQLVRDSDVTLSTDDRAAKANSVHPLLYLCLHASSEEGGISLFSAMLPEAAKDQGAFLNWDSAQSLSLATSHSIEQQLATAIQKSGLSVRALMAPLQPLNNIAAPALAIEISPTGPDVSQLLAADYQQMMSTVVANGIAAALSTGGQNPGAQQ
jgi:N-acetylmuramoyl-L-alanine amidase